MKKRAMKKYIPKGYFCSKCPYRRYFKTKLNRSNCDLSKICSMKCWTSDTTKCMNEVWICKYLGFIDKSRRTELWDGFKICEEKLM